MQLPDEIVLDDGLDDERPPSHAETGRKLVWIKKGALALADQALLSGSNFLIGILLARWLTRDDYGGYALGFSIFVFLSGFQNAFFTEPMSVLGPESYARCLSGYIKKLLGFHFVLALLLSTLAVASVILLPWFGADRGLISAMWGVCVAVPFVLFYWLCRRAIYLKFAPGLAVVSSATYCATSLIVVLALKKWLSPFMGFLAQSLAAIPAVLVLLAFMRSGMDREACPPTAHVLHQHWRYGRWVVGSTIVTWISGNAYYVIVGALLPMRDVATLRALRNLTEPCYRAMAAIILLVLPWAASRLAEEGRRGLQRRIRQLNWLFGGSALFYFAIICVFGTRVMRLLYGGRYDEPLILLVLATAPLVLIAASLGSEIAVQAMQAPSEVFLAYGASGALTLLLGVAFTRHWGLMGGLISILISSATVWGVLSYRCQKRLQALDPVPQREPRGFSGSELVS